jgi:hypothetical protein
MNSLTLDFANAFVSPGVNSRGELVPSHGASRRRLGDKTTDEVNTDMNLAANYVTPIK